MASQPGLGTAATIDSGRLDQGSLGLGPNRTPVVESAVHHIAAAGPARKSGAGALKVALALAVVVAMGGAGVAFWALTQSGDQQAKGAVAEKTDAATVAVADVPDAALSKPVVAGNGDNDTAKKETAKSEAAKREAAKEKAAKIAAAKEEAAKKKEAEKKEAAKKQALKDAAKKHGEGPTNAPGDGDGDGDEADDPERDYKEAKRLIRSNPKKALRLIGRALSHRKVGRYWVVKAKAHCVSRDLTRLNSTLGKLSGGNKRAVRTFCRKVWPDFD